MTSLDNFALLWSSIVVAIEASPERSGTEGSGVEVRSSYRVPHRVAPAAALAPPQLYLSATQRRKGQDPLTLSDYYQASRQESQLNKADARRAQSACCGWRLTRPDASPTRVDIAQ